MSVIDDAARLRNAEVMKRIVEMTGRNSGYHMNAWIVHEMALMLADQQKQIDELRAQLRKVRL